ncbi:signal transducer and transcription activator 6-like, partial [Empidonax traillii]|uniref:signal transducer and transcription activator 6-like n=1 Tax=Empidonax traillii TaxID=164674 RepID=UPI000FFDA349
MGELDARMGGGWTGRHTDRWTDSPVRRRVTVPKMSLWNVVSHMPQEEFSSLSTEFPRSLRCLLADWLENQPWEFLNGSDAFCTSMASRLFSALLEKLRSAAGPEGQQCQVLQQVNSLEVCGDLWPCRA